MDESIQKNEKLENEKELVERAKSDDQAFEILYSHYFPRIYGYLFKRIGNHEMCEDLVSTTFMKVFTNIKDYKHKGYTFGAWIYRIATNNLIDYYRKEGRKKEIDIEEIQELKDNQLNPEQIADIIYNKKIVMKVMVKLPEKHQRILQLKFFGELETGEIANVLEISENNTRVILHRALKNFRKIYQKYDKQ